ncbi:unnamed protein product [Arctia plantaginis]|uniref:Uncharacterized protein n=1 Tax=Arctia plantaginis TaxID=874455 RepID=A0A8S0YVM3_ARCPL|nr:unnamed protein product [Arctia plantaginis]
MNLQAELCLWTLLGLVRTIFDATLFKVNANLKQVWQMSMPAELSMPVQHVLRTMISGIMLVQCFTVYVYLASYIVLLYPVFLEERPALVLPWLLLAAIRKLLCELTSLAVGLGTCVLLGTAKPACIRFIVVKISSIMPAFYMWMLVYSYYHVLKVASAFKTFPVLLPPDEPDEGLELAVRRRRTKSLFTEEHLRKKLVAGFYAETSQPCTNTISQRSKLNTMALPVNTKCSDSSIDDGQVDGILQPLCVASTRNIDVGTYDDWFGSEVVVPRGDRILEQLITMLLRIGIYLNKDGAESIKSHMFNPNISTLWAPCENIEAVSSDGSDTPPHVANSKGHTASYLREYPQIFMKRLSSEAPQPDVTVIQVQNTESVVKNRLRTESYEIPPLEIEKNVSVRTLSLQNKKSSRSSISIGLQVPNPQNEQNHNENLNKFVGEIINNCIRTISDRSKAKSEEIVQSLIAFAIPSDETLLPKREELKKRLSCENSLIEQNKNEETDTSSSQSTKSKDEQVTDILEVQNSEAAENNSAGTLNVQNNQRNTSHTKNAASAINKVKKD